jgi:RNA polymerase sigma-70 factor (ECF subfamily)
MSFAALVAAPWMEREGARIARGLKRRDPDTLDQLIETYQHRLLRYLVYLTGNREFAEDLFQETWMRVLERGNQYNGKSRFDTWLFAIARHLVIDASRKKTCISLESLTNPAEESQVTPREFASSEPTPFDQTHMREESVRVDSALTHLDAVQREVVMLRFQEEMSLDEIAEVTGAPLSTVKSRLYRGLEALKPRLTEQQQRVSAERASHCASGERGRSSEALRSRGMDVQA